MLVKHNKYRNTGILFELLVRTITSDILSGKDSKATNILKKYFSKTELGREYKLYEILTKKTNLSEGKANIIIDSVMENSKLLNRTLLRKQKYNLIKEIKEHYPLEEFFKTKLPNYKTSAAIYTLLELYSNEQKALPNQIISNKLALLEHLTCKPIIIKKENNNVLDEFKTYDKDVRILTYKLLLEKFNNKYNNLNNNQKIVLKEFINSVDNTVKLKEFYNTKVKEIKNDLNSLNKNTKDKTIQIKINEVSNILSEVNKKYNVGGDDMIKLMQYYELLEELKLVK